MNAGFDSSIHSFNEKQRNAQNLNLHPVSNVPFWLPPVAARGARVHHIYSGPIQFVDLAACQAMNIISYDLSYSYYFPSPLPKNSFQRSLFSSIFHLFIFFFFRKKTFITGDDCFYIGHHRSAPFSLPQDTGKHAALNSHL